MSAYSMPRQGAQPRSVVSTSKQPSNPHSVSLPPAQPTNTPPKRVIFPARFRTLEPAKPISLINDDPVFDTRAAATILGVTIECLKKWRLRGQGPDYYQYGHGGPVRYLLSDLMKYRAAQLVQPRGKR